MYVSNFALNDYRSYRELVIELPPGRVAFLGKNGRGKTNLVEAVGYLSTLTSHRGNPEKSLLRLSSEPGKQTPKRSEAAVIRARINTDSESRVLELELVSGKANRARMNRTPVSPRELTGHLRTVVFAPEDLQLFRGEPSLRRRLLDDVLVQVKPSYAAIRRDFDQVSRQRAAALKQFYSYPRGEDLEGYLQPWDEAFASLSAAVTAHRQSLVSGLSPYFKARYEEVSHGDREAAVGYQSNFQRAEGTADADTETLELLVPTAKDGFVPDLSAAVENIRTRLLPMLRQRREEELRRGVNLTGAHRDDFEVQIGSLPVKSYASQGETWSALLALRLAQMDFLTIHGDTPVLILDDVFAHLDEDRRAALVESILPVEQVLITAAVREDLPEDLSAHSFLVNWNEDEGSEITPATPAELSAP